MRIHFTIEVDTPESFDVSIDQTDSNGNSPEPQAVQWSILELQRTARILKAIRKACRALPWAGK